jgi:hypothetical protein
MSFNKASEVIKSATQPISIDTPTQDITSEVGASSFAPTTQSVNDLSDLRVTRQDKAEVSPNQLPIRGEKRLVPSFISINSAQDQIDSGISGMGLNPDDRSAVIDYNSFVINAAKKTFVDYVVVRVPHRGYDANGRSNLNSTAEFRFLINPSTLQVNRTTVDYQAMTRAGWQFGVWGEDIVRISLSGQTAGQYFELGLTDAFSYFTQSYRNLQQLIMVYENNGYWFEGEEAGEGPLKARDFTRRRIKMHQDVELVVGNFVWYGMFDALTVRQDANTPFSNNFDISFIAWKERFRTGSPYIDALENNVQRGHTYGAYVSGDREQLSEINSQVQNLPLHSSTLDLGAIPIPQALPPAVQSAVAEDKLPTISPSAYDFTPMEDVFNPTNGLWGK